MWTSGCFSMIRLKSNIFSEISRGEVACFSVDLIMSVSPVLVHPKFEHVVNLVSVRAPCFSLVVT